MECCNTKDNKMDKKEEEKEHKKVDYEFYVQIALVAILAILLVYNIGKITNNGNSAAGLAIGFGSVSASDIIPKGVPAVYGSVLGVKYDDVSANNPQLAETTIAKLAQYEDMQLNEEKMTRYIRIGSSISCEYCCGAKALIFSNGQRACGCAHSYAMRGLAKYLLANNPEMSDAEILNELGKWKVLFFPGVHEQKARALEANGIESKNYINLASNLYRGIEQGQTTNSGGQVGNC